MSSRLGQAMEMMTQDSLRFGIIFHDAILSSICRRQRRISRKGGQWRTEGKCGRILSPLHFNSQFSTRPRCSIASTDGIANTTGRKEISLTIAPLETIAASVKECSCWCMPIDEDKRFVLCQSPSQSRKLHSWSFLAVAVVVDDVGVVHSAHVT